MCESEKSESIVLSEKNVCLMSRQMQAQKLDFLYI